MNSKNIFGISQAEPLQILKISIEQEFGYLNIKTSFDYIKVLGVQATTSVINPNLPDVKSMEIEYITTNGIFDNEFVFGIGIAHDFEDVNSFEVNFIWSRDSDTGSLIVPKEKYPPNQPLENKYMERIVEELTLPDGYSKELSKEQICSVLYGIFREMTQESETALEIDMGDE